MNKSEEMTSPREERIPRTPNGILAILFYAVHLSLFYFTADPIYRFFLSMANMPDFGQAADTVWSIFSGMYLFAILLFFLLAGRFHLRETLYMKPCRPVILIPGILGIYLLAQITGNLTAWAGEIFPFLQSPHRFDFFLLCKIREPTTYILFALSVGLFPGVTEELAFRGFMLRGMLARHRKITAVILTALFFGIIHLRLLDIVNCFFSGLFLGYLVIRTGSVYPALVAHIFLNLMITVQNSVIWILNPDLRLEKIFRSDPVFLVVGMVFFPPVLAFLHYLTMDRPPAIR